MFQVQRYDPREEDHKKNRDREGFSGKQQSRHPGKRKRKDSTDPKLRAEKQKDPEIHISTQNQSVSTFRVIAEESKPSSALQQIRPLSKTDEAFDDFDIEADLLENNIVQEGERNKEPDEETASLPDEVRTALHMSSLPIERAALSWQLAPFLIDNLKRDGYKNFFPIQALVIPDVIASERYPHLRARDICVSSRTGSGKSLAFVLPVLNALANRNVRRLRALVVLPSRDLASQVYEVFERYAHGSDLRIGLAIGRTDFEAEQKTLTVGALEASDMFDTNLLRHRYSFDPGNVTLALEAFGDTAGTERCVTLCTDQMPLGGRSAVDVLVVTPGRLIDHLDKTPGFTLQHLRFLVIDEADRLLNQSYHNWVGRVIAATNGASINAWRRIRELRRGCDGQLEIEPFQRDLDGKSFVIDPITWRRGDNVGDDSSFDMIENGNFVEASVCRPVQLRKMLFSATLTKDPQKLAVLGLDNPKHFDAHNMRGTSKTKFQRYSMPPELSEYTVQCTAEQKPLVLLALLLEHLQRKTLAGKSKNIMVVFTSSLDSTHRLARLLQLLWLSAEVGDPSSVAEFSSALNQRDRTNLMKRCMDVDDNVCVLVCSDGMSRGMDIPDVNVVNYDVPSFAKTYVHRCGRSSRAGKAGMAITLLKGGQVGLFTKMRSLIDQPERVCNMGVQKELVGRLLSKYRACVRALRDVLQAEENGDLSTTEIVPESFAP